MSRVGSKEGRKAFKGDLQVGWDATSIELAQTCMRKYYYTMIEGWSPNEKSVHLLFGGHYAKALENYYKYLAAGATAEESLHRVVHEALIESKQEPYPPHSAKTRYSLIRAIVWYFEEFGDERHAAIKTHYLSDGMPAVEMSFQIDVAEDITLSGHMDRVVSWNDGLYAMDQKTTGSALGSYFFDQFNPHNQFSLYSFAGQIVFNSPVRGVIIDAAQILAGGVKFMRGTTLRTEEQLQEWWTNTEDTIRRAQEASFTGKYPMNLSACGNYGGCPFRPVCARPESSRSRFLKADFNQKTHWDPMEAR